MIHYAKHMFKQALRIFAYQSDLCGQRYKGHCTTSRRLVDSSIPPPQVLLPLQWAGLVWRRREGGGEEKDLAMIKSEAAHTTFSPRTGRHTAVSETQL